jgi:hypothetical protein
MIKQIISGGQTGVDQAALAVASELGLKVGGWCPNGGLDEKGNCILKRYPSMKQTKTINPEVRTKLNIETSDGTLIIVPSLPLPEKIKDGTLLTINHVKEKKKPYLIISLDQTDSIEQFKNWLIEHNTISVLNVAGPRESNWPGINKLATELLRDMIKRL